MRLGQVFLVSIAVSCALALLADESRSSMPCECRGPASVILGKYDQVGTNARFLFPRSELPQQPDQFVLQATAPIQETVTLRVEPAGDTGEFVWLIPTEELKPNTTYDAKQFALHIKTSEGPDRIPPTLGSVRVSPRIMQGACPEHNAAYLEVVSIQDDRSGRGVFVKVRLRGEGGERLFFLSSEGGFFGDQKWNQVCLSNAPGVQVGKDYEITVTAVDSAGNESKPTVYSPVRFAHREAPGPTLHLGPLRPTRGCACSQAGIQESAASSLGAGWSLVLVGAGLRRRRRIKGGQV